MLRSERAKATAGDGMLVLGHRQVPVEYDLVLSPAGLDGAEGRLFGNADDLREAFNGGPALLRLDSGDAAIVMLTDCEVHGAADVRVVGLAQTEGRSSD